MDKTGRFDTITSLTYNRRTEGDSKSPESNSSKHLHNEVKKRQSHKVNPQSHNIIKTHHTLKSRYVLLSREPVESGFERGRRCCL
ncbi:hypothetical protein TNIN_255391 [Trichonephila inaurata madagascariensis]|uniref:Uncharacterized protein n=1 Tax=Trichonephila inaurata madagascariensis TaxID=2747483 RepID=A0A8X6XA30_9ARAC|nr:hypothetical protein TNIN_255391 [Trichonephila inaurata madagascariensis]